MRARLIKGLLACIALGSIGLTILSLFGNGLFMRVGEVRVSARSPSRPFALAACALMALAYASPGVRARAARIRAAFERRAVVVGWSLAGLLCVMAVGLALRYGSFVASAADSYGYVTQAEAFAGARSVEPDPMALSLPWPNARWTVTPLGYVPGAAERIVPVYPPGLPLLMAAFSLSAGHPALYLVVPVAAAGAILATFLLGLRIGGPGPGLGAAVLLLSSPVFLFSACVPMSDVPAAALWTFAWLAALRGTPVGGLGAGVLAGAALLVRPNLAPLAAPLLGCLAFGWGTGSRARSWRLPALFMLGVLPGLATLMVLNASRYGSPMALGYGPVASLFAAGYLGPNMRRFASWFLETQTPFVFVGLLALVPSIARRVSGSSRTEDAVRPLLLWVLTVLACYAFYLPFDSWGYLRFLLPAFPPLFVLAIVVTRAALQRLPQPWDWLVVVSLVMLVALTTWDQARVNDVFNNERSVRRFVDVPRFASAELAPDAIYLTRVYSGSMRYYGARRTLRWDVLEPAWLDQAITELLGRGLVPYIVIEVSDEADLFRQRFASQEFGRLDWPPAAEYGGTERVHIYDPRDRARARGGQSVATRSIPVSAQAIARQ